MKKFIVILTICLFGLFLSCSTLKKSHEGEDYYIDGIKVLLYSKGQKNFIQLKGNDGFDLPCNTIEEEAVIFSSIANFKKTVTYAEMKKARNELTTIQWERGQQLYIEYLIKYKENQARMQEFLIRNKLKRISEVTVSVVNSNNYQHWMNATIQACIKSIEENNQVNEVLYTYYNSVFTNSGEIINRGFISTMVMAALPGDMYQKIWEISRDNLLPNGYDQPVFNIASQLIGIAIISNLSMMKAYDPNYGYIDANKYNELIEHEQNVQFGINDRITQILKKYNSIQFILEETKLIPDEIFMRETKLIPDETFVSYNVHDTVKDPEVYENIEGDFLVVVIFTDRIYNVKINISDHYEPARISLFRGKSVPLKMTRDQYNTYIKFLEELLHDELFMRKSTWGNENTQRRF